MKKLIQKIGLLVIAVIASLAVNAQTGPTGPTIEVSITTIAGTTVLENNGAPYDVTNFGDAVQNLFPLTVKIANKGDVALTLNQISGKYINLSGTGATDFTVDESGTASSIAAGGFTTFTVDISSGATNGTGKLVTLNISSNDAVNGTFAGSIKYTFTNRTPTAVAKGSDIGLSLYPNPSSDGHMFVSADNINVERIVISNVSGQTEEFASKEFTTAMKGLLLVRVYTDKGVVSEKIIIKE